MTGTQTTARKLIHIGGSDAETFLQGLVSNDTKGLTDGLVYAAILTPQGKYLADFFMVPDGDAILLDCDAEQAPGLVKRLSMYKLRADVTVALDPRVVSLGTGTAPEGSFPDPRHDALGWRAYGETDISDDTDWDALRVAHVIPQAGIELTPDSFILEMGFERLNGVDFKKGCYVGQEINARMKHKTELRKGLAQVTIDGHAPIDTEIVTDAGKVAGTLFTQSGGKALAYLRFDRATEAMTAGEAKVSYTD